MEVQIRIFLFVCLATAATAYSYDEDCFADFSQSFPSDPVVQDDRIQVDIVHTFNTDEASYQFRSRSKEILYRGQQHVFHYNHPDTPHNPRNLTLFFDGSTVFGAMAAFVELFTDVVNKTTWKCLSSSQIDQTFRYYDVSKFNLYLSFPKHCRYICVFAPQMALLGFFVEMSYCSERNKMWHSTKPYEHKL